MVVKSLEVTNYRNYKKQYVEFILGVNVIVGANAQGKTNLLEAVYFSSVGKSHKTPRDKELILWGEQRAAISIQSDSHTGGSLVEIIIDKSENKRIAINRLPISKMGELMGVIPTVFFSPSEVKIINSSPSERRSFMDIALCQMSKAYFYLLQRYNKVLSQRNKLLKSGGKGDALDVWDMQLCDSGAKIIKSRKGYLNRLKEFTSRNHLELSDGLEELELKYDGEEGDTYQEIYDNLYKSVLSYRDKDMLLGYTHAGPHKDDIIIKVNNADVRTYGSQGQLRTAALSLKLAELDLYTSETGQAPILLLDDVLSELDKTRQKKLLLKAQTVQTLITATHIEDDVLEVLKNHKVFTVEAGKVT